jgi:2-aminobenzoate-CoA ligase
VFEFDRPELQYPPTLNAADPLLEDHVREGHGARTALHGQAEGALYRWTYAELLALVDRIAQVLVNDLGLRSGNRLLLRGANSPMLAACVLAGLKAGLVLVPTMPLLRSFELQQILEKAQVDAALCAHQLIGELRHCLDPLHPHHVPGLRTVLSFSAPADPLHQAPSCELSEAMRKYTGNFAAIPTSRDDVCLIAFTSGTTGRPKGTMHFHRDLLAMCDLFPRHLLRMHCNDIVCGTPPLAFTFGLGGLLCFPLRYGASTVLLERHTPESLLHTIANYRATQCYTAPTFYRQMAALAIQYDLSSLRLPVSAGEVLPAATRQLWEQATGIVLCDGIGGTELMHIYLASAGEGVRAGCIGKAVPGYSLRVVDQRMQTLPAGEAGRLAVRGPTGCRYLHDPRQRDYVIDGWNVPGDTFVMDEDGYFRYLARNDDMIISAGYNIAGPEVEDAVLLHQAVAECGVVGLPDEERGQIVTAFVVARPGHPTRAALAEDIQAFVKARLAPYKYPRRIVFVDQLPRTETGKLQRFRLRQPQPA